MTEPATDGPPEPDTTGIPGVQDPDQDPGDSVSREAAKYRTRLRETEAERDALGERLARFQRVDAERLAAESLSRPSDLWLDGVNPADLVDDDGNVVPELVQTAIAGVLDSRPQLAKGYGAQRGPSVFGVGAHAPIGGDYSWSDVISSGNR